MNIKFSPKDFFKKNLYLILFLLCANILGLVSVHYFNHDTVFGLIDLFDFDTEKNIPTIYSSIALLFSSILLLFIALTSKRLKSSYIPWFGLSLIFLFLSIDETFLIHERFVDPLRDNFGASGIFHYAWVIPYGIALIIFLIAYTKFLFSLPRDTMILFIVSGAIFVSGAIGMEMIEGSYAILYGKETILYAVMYTIEEFLEMFGIVLFIYTLLSYIVNQFGPTIVNQLKPITITLTENKIK